MVGAGVSARLPSVLPLLARIAAAVLGGYAFAATGAVWLAFALPAERAQAVLTGLLVSFALYAAAVIWVFAARTAVHAWAGLLLPTLAFAGLAWLSGLQGAP